MLANSTKDTALQAAAKDIAYGSIAGMVSEVVEYPFDLAKVRLQAQLLSPASGARMRFNGPLDCLRETWKHEGVKGLYRGLSVPLFGAMAETASLFVAYSYFQNLIRTYSPSPPGSSAVDTPPLTITQLALAGAGAGFVTSFILTPIELIKCKMQVQMMNTHTSAHIPPTHRIPIPALIPPIRVASLPLVTLATPHSSIYNFISNGRLTISPALTPAFISSSGRQPPGPFSIIRSTVHTYGVRGLWLGHSGNLLLETGGSAAWFVLKEYVAGLLRARRDPSYGTGLPLHGEAKPDLLPWESALSGAVSGGICVLAFYPIDTVKSGMQTEDELGSRAVSLKTGTTRSSRISFWGTLSRMYANHGVRGLYAGCGMTVARAVPSSAIIFLVYDGLSA